MIPRVRCIVVALLVTVFAGACGAAADARARAPLQTPSGDGAATSPGRLQATAEPRSFLPTTAEADTALERFLSGMSDSTDRYFGDTAAPRDTAGLDSSLAYGLKNPSARRPRARLRITPLPDFAFNRVDGPVWGGSVRAGASRDLGQLIASVGWAAGPNRLLGEGAYKKMWASHGGSWRLDLWGGRATAVMDRTRADHGDEQASLSTLRALVGGGDSHRYLRHDGWSAGFERERERWRAGVGFRDMLESPLPVTAGWTLRKKALAVPDNLPAAFGRAREARFEVAWLWPRFPIQTEIQHQSSGDAIGSDFEYRRTRVASAATLGLGAHFSLVPQAVYGRVTGRPTPQSSFYMGGESSLRSVAGAALGGTSLALARVDLLGVDDVLTLAHVPHPAWLPLQLGAFFGSGAVWGADPYGGAGTPEARWPQREHWLSEAGVSLIYQPGIPDPTTLVRFDWARPLGPGGRESRLSFGVTRAIDLLRPLR